MQELDDQVRKYMLYKTWEEWASDYAKPVNPLGVAMASVIFLAKMLN
jgi:hypothetical protein